MRTGNFLERSKVPLRVWAIAVYMYLAGFKGINSMRMHRELDVTQKTAWFMLQRIRAAYQAEETFEGRHKMRKQDTIDHMHHTNASMVRRLMNKVLVGRENRRRRSTV